MRETIPIDFMVVVLCANALTVVTRLRRIYTDFVQTRLNNLLGIQKKPWQTGIIYKKSIKQSFTMQNKERKT